MAGGGGGGSGGEGGGTFDPNAWHIGGDNIPSAKVIGSTSDFDVRFIRNNFQVMQLEFENLNTKDYHYLGFDRNTDEGQYVTCIQEQHQGIHAYVAMEFTNLDGGGNVVGDCDLGIAGHGYAAAIAGLEADDYFLTSNHGMYLKGAPIKFMLWTGAITASEVMRISTLGGAYTTGVLEFNRDAVGAPETILVGHNTKNDDYIRIQLLSDTADTSFGVTGSAYTPTAILDPNDLFLWNKAGGMVLVASGTNPVRINVDGGKVAQYYDNGVDTIFVPQTFGRVNRYTILELNCQGGPGTDFANWVHFTNSAGQRGFVTMPESGGGDFYHQKSNFVTTAGSLGVGVRCNVNAANNTGWEIDANAYMTINAARLGLYSATPVAQQTVTGSRGGNAALASLLSKLALTGIVVDGTSP